MDVLINNASMKVKGAVQSISLELDKKIMDANYFGPITLTKGILIFVYLLLPLKAHGQLNGLMLPTLHAEFR